MIALLLALVAQDRVDLAERLDALQRVYASRRADIDAGKREKLVALLNEVTSARLEGKVDRAIDGLALARELLDGTPAKARLAVGPRVVQSGAAAAFGVKVLPVGGASGAATLRVRNARGEVLFKQEVEFGKGVTVDLDEQVAGAYEVEAGGAAAVVQLVHDLHARVKKLAADLPVKPEDAVAAGLVARLSVLQDLAAGKPAEAGGFVEPELRSLEEDVKAWQAGDDPLAKRRGHQQRALARGAAYRAYVPKGYDGTKAWPLVVALHDAGLTEHSWFGPLADLAEERGFVAVAVRSPLFGTGTSHVGPVIEQAKRDWKVGKVWLLGHGQGAAQALALAGEAPGAFAGVIALAPSARAEAAKLKGLEVRLACGAKDPLVEVARELAGAAKKAGHGAFTYVERPGVERMLVVADELADAASVVR